MIVKRSYLEELIKKSYYYVYYVKYKTLEDK
jgi:hypothetical protein